MQRTSAPNIAGAHLPQRARGYWTVRFHATREGVESFLERERAQLPLWLVVGFGAGIASWFALDGSVEWLAVICIGAGLAVAGFSFEGGRLGAGNRLARALPGIGMRSDLAAFRVGSSAPPRAARGHYIRGKGRASRGLGGQGRPSLNTCDERPGTSAIGPRLDESRFGARRNIDRREVASSRETGSATPNGFAGNP